MPSRIYLGTIIPGAFLALLTALPTSADEAQDPAGVVRQFNAAITERDIDAALATLAEGSVQMQLRAVHPGMSENPPLTADLPTMWKTVAAVLFQISESYTRSADISESTADGEIATVWANTTTRTKRKDKDEATERSFSEVYLLVKKDGSWKIAAMADNRSRDNVQIDSAQPVAGE